MGKSLGSLVIKVLKEKTETRKIIKCDDFFELIQDMGLNDDSDEIIDIVNYLEENNTDINFHNSETKDYYSRYKNIEKKVQLSKMLQGSKTEVQKMIEKVESIQVQERPDWLEMYRDDDDNNYHVEYTGNSFQRITDMITQELKNKIENEPGPTLDEVQNEIEVEMGLPRPFNISELNPNELKNFLSNLEIPERFRENNNN